MKHLHHLVPKHRGGTDADGLVEVSVIRHAMFHFCEWRLHGHWQDKTAWKMLVGSQEHPRTGSTNSEERRAEISRRNKELWANPEHRAKMKKAFSEAAKKPERLEMLREQGKRSELNHPKHEEKRRKRHAEVWEITHRVEKDGVVEHLTKKEFVARHGGTLASCKQMVWRKGAYLGWTFT